MTRILFHWTIPLHETINKGTRTWTMNSMWKQVFFYITLCVMSRKRLVFMEWQLSGLAIEKYRVFTEGEYFIFLRGFSKVKNMYYCPAAACGVLTLLNSPIWLSYVHKQITHEKVWKVSVSTLLRLQGDGAATTYPSPSSIPGSDKEVMRTSVEREELKCEGFSLVERRRKYQMTVAQDLWCLFFIQMFLLELPCLVFVLDLYHTPQSP